MTIGELISRNITELSVSEALLWIMISVSLYVVYRAIKEVFIDED